jgi:hypothetical protein
MGMASSCAYAGLGCSAKGCTMKKHSAGMVGSAVVWQQARFCRCGAVVLPHSLDQDAVAVLLCCRTRLIRMEPRGSNCCVS